MTEASNQPEWLERWRASGSGAPIPPAPAPATTPAKTRDSNGRWVKGMSGNPRGKEPGTLDKRQELQNAFAEDAVDIVRAVVAKAKEGDVGAANIVLSRLLPPLRQQTERVQFELSSSVPLSEQAEQIVQAVAQGLLDSETARMLIGCLASVADMKAIENLEARVLSLEAKQIG